MPLVLSAAPRQAKAGANGSPVLSKAGGEVLDHPHAASLCFDQLSIEDGDDAWLSLLTATASSHDLAEPAAEIDDLGHLVILQHT